MTIEELANCTLERWRPVIGDPNLTGWLTVLAYLACAVLCLRVWRRDPPARGFWGVLVLLMLLLAINKQLDLQSAMTAAGRCLAKAQGWYGNRRAIQADFILALLALTSAGLLAGLWLMRRSLRQNGLALIGLSVLAGFVMIRAIGFHRFDQLIGTMQFGVRTNYLFENAGLLLIAINAALILRQRHKRTAQPG